MKTYHLEPTFENLFYTYQKDIIQRNNDIFHFIKILNSVKNNYTIALDGNWGSGKTFFVKQVKMVLDAYNEENTDKKEIIDICKKHYDLKNFNLQPQFCVYYDAWKNDYDEDPMLSLVYSILKSTKSDFKGEKIDFITMAASIMEAFSGKNWSQVIQNLRGQSPLDELKKRKDLNESIGEFLSSLLEKKGNRLIIFIDELDRCKPDYAVRLLERIKHYFTQENITFVFSINMEQLQHTIKKYYGNDFDVFRYLDRFFDLKITLPAPNLAKYYQSLNLNTETFYDITCKAVIEAFHFELREIAKFLSLTDPYRSNSSSNNRILKTGPHDNYKEKTKLFCLCYILPVMLALKVKNIQQYNEFVNGNDASPLLKVGESIKSQGLNNLLNEDETFDKNTPNKIKVTLAEKLQAVYNAIFVPCDSNEVYHKQIGSLLFNNGLKAFLSKAANFLSTCAHGDNKKDE